MFYTFRKLIFSLKKWILLCLICFAYDLHFFRKFFIFTKKNYAVELALRQCFNLQCMHNAKLNPYFVCLYKCMAVNCYVFCVNYFQLFIDIFLFKYLINVLLTIRDSICKGFQFFGYSHRKSNNIQDFLKYCSNPTLYFFILTIFLKCDRLKRKC